MENIVLKIKNKLWSKLVRILRVKSYYPKIYRSYWHKCYSITGKNTGENYLTAIPNRGAGIGHQMANWIAGYWFAKQFGLKFAHTPFSSKKWESFLGFGSDEKNVDDLIAIGYKKVRLPLFDEFNVSEIELQQQIIASYSNLKVVFVAEQDQFYRDQFGVMEDIQEKFHTAPARKKDQLIYDPLNYNIAIHVRRGDIAIGQENLNPNLMMRWQSNDYFEMTLKSVLSTLETVKPVKIYLFSQGEKKDFQEFEQFANLNFCLGMNAEYSFLHMVFADLLITSKSSFSYKPALLCKGIKVCPENFWHGYPLTKDWIMSDEFGNFNNLK